MKNTDYRFTILRRQYCIAIYKAFGIACIIENNEVYFMLGPIILEISRSKKIKPTAGVRL
tara:strand:- start:1236 stop:1415 length:180 start_codon:yes stop_codon:yes gene_type:complete